MAETNFQEKGAIKVYLGTEINFGTATLAAGTWVEPPVIDFTLPQLAAPVAIGSNRAGLRAVMDTQVKHTPDTKMYEFSLTLEGTVKAVLNATHLLFEDGTSEADLTGSYAFPTTYSDTTASTSQMTVLFAGAGSDATNVDIVCTSCVATSVVFSESLDSEAGNLTAEVTLVTGYKPSEEALTPVGPTKDTGSIKNIRSLTTFTLAAEALVPLSWSITATRPVGRVLYQDTTDYKPYGYTMDGGFEVTGTIQVKRDDSIYDMIAKFSDSSTNALAIAESSGFTIDCPTVIINEPTIDLDSYLKQTIPFTCTGNAASESDTILGITIS